MANDKMKVTAELMRRGATMLAEPCPTCGGIQVKYNGRVICTSHDDLSGILTTEELSYEALAAELRQVLLAKLSEMTGLLQREKGRQEQEVLVTLMAKYVDLLQKLPQK